MKKFKRIAAMVLLTFSCIAYATNSYAASDGESPQYTKIGDYSNSGEAGINPMQQGISNCHFYTWGRVFEMHGISMGKGVLSWQREYVLHTEPKAHSVALWGDKSHTGHSAYVEDVNGSQITFSEGGYRGGYNYTSTSYENFKNWALDGSPLLGFIYFDESETPPATDDLTISITTADEVTTTNAIVRGEVSYTGEKPSEYGLYLGTSKKNMSKVASDSRPDFNLNPYPIWYDINAEANIILEPNTTYYWRCYAIQSGREIQSGVKSFKTKKSGDKASVKTTTVDEITSSNAVVRGEVSYTGAKPSEYGIYFGKSTSKMTKVACDSTPDFDLNPYPIWYDLNVEAGLTLTPDTKYYWKCYVIQNGKEYKGSTKHFTTTESSNSDAENGENFSGGGGSFGGGGGGGRF